MPFLERSPADKTTTWFADELIGLFFCDGKIWFWSPFGGFLKWWKHHKTPHFMIIFSRKPIVVGYHHFRKPPCGRCKTLPSCPLKCHWHRAVPFWMDVPDGFSKSHGQPTVWMVLKPDKIMGWFKLPTVSTGELILPDFEGPICPNRPIFAGLDA